MIAFRVATGARNAGEFNCHLMMPPKDLDPYALALSNGLTPDTDHPVGALLSDIDRRCPFDSHGVDFGVVGGFKKAWSIFPPDDLQGVSRLARSRGAGWLSTVRVEMDAAAACRHPSLIS